MLTRKTQYAWMGLGGLICLFGLVLACKIRDGNKASAQPELLPPPTLIEKDQPPTPPAVLSKPSSDFLSDKQQYTVPLRSVTIKEKPQKDSAPPKITLEMPSPILSEPPTSGLLPMPMPMPPEPLPPVLPASFNPNTPTPPESAPPINPPPLPKVDSLSSPPLPINPTINGATSSSCAPCETGPIPTSASDDSPGQTSRFGDEKRDDASKSLECSEPRGSNEWPARPADKRTWRSRQHQDATRRAAVGAERPDPCSSITFTVPKP